MNTKLENEPINIEEVYSYKSNKPVFFGHYRLKGVPKIINKKAICLNYSVAEKGQLVSFKSEYLTNLEQIENGFVYKYYKLNCGNSNRFRYTL